MEGCPPIPLWYPMTFKVNIERVHYEESAVFLLVSNRVIERMLSIGSY